MEFEPNPNPNSQTCPNMLFNSNMELRMKSSFPNIPLGRLILGKFSQNRVLCLHCQEMSYMKITFKLGEIDVDFDF